MDDLIGQVDKHIVEIFTRASHHRSLSVFYTQNLFHNGQCEISLNSSYIVVFKNPRDRAQIAHFARQIWPKNSRCVPDAYIDISSKPHSYLMFDLKQSMPENCRLKKVQTPGDALSRLDSELCGILHSNSFQNDSEKWLAYQEILEKYLQSKGVFKVREHNRQSEEVESQIEELEKKKKMNLTCLSC